MPNLPERLALIAIAALGTSGCLTDEPYDQPEKTEFRQIFQTNECSLLLASKSYPGDTAPQSTPAEWTPGTYVLSGVDVYFMDCKAISLDEIEIGEAAIMLVSTVGRAPPKECRDSHASGQPGHWLEGLYANDHGLAEALSSRYSIPGNFLEIERVMDDQIHHVTWGSEGGELEFTQLAEGVDPYRESYPYYWQTMDGLGRMQIAFEALHSNENQVPAHGQFDSLVPKMQGEPDQWAGIQGILDGSTRAPIELFQDNYCT